MEENLKVDKKYKEAYNLGYEVTKELDLKTPMFQNQSIDITNSLIQGGMLQYLQDRQASLNQGIGNTNETLKRSIIKKTIGKNRNRDNGLTP